MNLGIGRLTNIYSGGTGKSEKLSATLEVQKKETVEKLIDDMLNSPDPDIQLEATKKLGKFSKNMPQEGIDALIKAMRRVGSTDFTELEAIKILGKIGPRAKGAIPHLTTCLEYNHMPFKQAEAAKALGGIGIPDEKAIHFLREKLKKDDELPVIRSSAAWALGKLKDYGASSILADWVNHDETDQFIRARCAEALGNLGVIRINDRLNKELDEKVSAGLLEASKNENKFIRYAAEQAIRKRIIDMCPK
ncbi:MAG: HEAT repeat domain-containing protein [Armatimonadota bacterium]